MSEHQLDTLRNKISQSQLIIAEIFEAYKSIAGNEALKQTEQQLYEINKAIRNLESTATPVPDALREVKNQMTNNLVIKTEADKILEDFKAYLSNLFIDISPKHSKQRKSKGGRLSEEESLDLVLEMVVFMNKEKYDFSEAAKMVANKLGISRQSVRNKCSRGLNLQMRSFKSLASNNISQLSTYIIKSFPDFEPKIKSTLGV